MGARGGAPDRGSSRGSAGWVGVRGVPGAGERSTGSPDGLGVRGEPAVDRRLREAPTRVWGGRRGIPGSPSRRPGPGSSLPGRRHPAPAGNWMPCRSSSPASAPRPRATRCSRRLRISQREQRTTETRAWDRAASAGPTEPSPWPWPACPPQGPELEAGPRQAFLPCSCVRRRPAPGRDLRVGDVTQSYRGWGVFDCGCEIQMVIAPGSDRWGSGAQGRTQKWPDPQLCWRRGVHGTRFLIPAQLPSR